MHLLTTDIHSVRPNRFVQTSHGAAADKPAGVVALTCFELRRQGLVRGANRHVTCWWHYLGHMHILVADAATAVKVAIFTEL